MSILWVIIAILLIVMAPMIIKIIPQQRVLVIERLGKYNRTMSAGLNLMIPWIESVRTRHDLRVRQTDVPPQSVITKDNVNIEIDSIIFYQVIDPEKATYGIQSFESGVQSICMSTMRQILGKMELDETLGGREHISLGIRTALDEATEKWGIRIDRVEVVNIQPPEEIQKSMDQQMMAERNKRATILNAEAAQRDAILRAEGEKQSQILRAEGDMQARIKEAEGSQAAQELEAKGRAEAIRLVAEAEKMRIEQLKDAGLDDKVLTYKSFEALTELGKGESNTIFIPTAAVETLGAVGAVSELFKTKK